MPRTRENLCLLIEGKRPPEEWLNLDSRRSNGGVRPVRIAALDLLILLWRAQGLSLKDMADLAGTTPKAMERWVSRLKEQYELASPADLVLFVAAAFKPRQAPPPPKPYIPFPTCGSEP